MAVRKSKSGVSSSGLVARTCCEAGHAAETLFFLANHFWFSAEQDSDFPLCVTACYSLLEARLGELAASDNADISDSQILQDLAVSVDNAFRAFQRGWLNGKHLECLTVLWESDLESQLEFLSEGRSIQLSEVIGVCVLLVRPMP